MKIGEVTSFLDSIAPPALKEPYDNVGLILGSKSWECKGILISLDATEAVMLEAAKKNCNLVVTHHPVIFHGLKKIIGQNYVEKAVIAAVKNEIAVFAIHTNFDNVIQGVSGKMAEILQLKDFKILFYKENTLKKLFTFIPPAQSEEVRIALFEAGAGKIGKYSECSFSDEGTGTFKAGEGTNPYMGEIGKRESAIEIKVEVVFPAFLEKKVVEALIKAHPYEEVAYDIVNLSNLYQYTGSGIVGTLSEPQTEIQFLTRLKKAFNLKTIRHSPLTGKQILKVALCGGAGSFLIPKALDAGADVFITGDIKYHEFFDADGQMLIADIGHFESEQFTIDLLYENLVNNFHTFAILKSEITTNPVNYFF